LKNILFYLIAWVIFGTSVLLFEIKENIFTISFLILSWITLIFFLIKDYLNENGEN